jgi:hypothetical protein
MSSLIDLDDKSIAREAFASFLRAACPLATDAHWYSIRGTYSDDSLLQALTILSYLPNIFLAAENLKISAVATQPNQTGYTPTNMSPHHAGSIIDHFLTISTPI